MPSPGAADRASLPSFSPAGADIRQADWTVASDKAADATLIVVDTVDKIFGLEELLFKHRDTAVTLQLDPDGYLFSFILACGDRPECILPDRADMTYSTHCLRCYARHVRDVATRRGADLKATPDDNLGAFLESDEPVVAEDLLQVPRGRITERGVRSNIRTVLQGIATQLAAGTPPENRSEIELSRAQLWQWTHFETGVLDTGRIITPELFDEWLAAELDSAKASGTDVDPAVLDQAAALIAMTTHADTLAASLVDDAYRLAD